MKTIIKQIDRNKNFPNNKDFPVIVYKNAISAEEENKLKKLRSLFNENQWGGMWENGIYNYHHYHSTAHEVLGIYSGHVKVQLGGSNGEIFDLEAGDVIIIPAGVAHKNLGSSSDFKCLGAYPPGQSFDMNYGHADELPNAMRNIDNTELPDLDPLFGENGALISHWHQQAKVE